MLNSAPERTASALKLHAVWRSIYGALSADVSIAAGDSPTWLVLANSPEQAVKAAWGNRRARLRRGRAKTGIAAIVYEGESLNLLCQCVTPSPYLSQGDNTPRLLEDFHAHLRKCHVPRRTPRQLWSSHD